MASPLRLAKARTIYIFGVEGKDGKHIFPSLKQIAKKLGMSPYYLQEVAAREGWSKQRAEVYREVTRRVQERLIQENVEQSVKIRSALVKGAVLGISLIQHRMAQIAVAMREQAQEPVSPKESAVKSWEMRDLAASLETLKRVAMDALGEHNIQAEVTWQDIARMARGEDISG